MLTSKSKKRVPRKPIHHLEERRQRRAEARKRADKTKRPLERLPEFGFVALPTVVQMFDSSPSTIWRWIKAGTFPPPDKINGSTRWSIEKLRAYTEKIRNGAA